MLALTDFGTYSDPEATPLAKVQIVTLPGSGSLEWFNGTAWVAVTAGQEILAADINTNRLRFTPAANATTGTSLTFKVSDGSALSANAYTLSLDITAVNDAPSGTDKSVTLNLGLTDLDGRTITAPGWYDFTQRVPGGDGARFITVGGKITAIELILTDNAFGDNDPVVGRISDPGVPVNDGENSGGGGEVTPSPTITGPSNGPGAANSTKTIPENTAPVAAFTANEPVTWSIFGGTDGGLFRIDPQTGSPRTNWAGAGPFGDPCEEALTGEGSLCQPACLSAAAGWDLVAWRAASGHDETGSEVDRDTSNFKHGASEECCRRDDKVM